MFNNLEKMVLIQNEIFKRYMDKKISTEEEIKILKNNINNLNDDLSRAQKKIEAYEETLNEYFQKDDPEIKGKIRLLGHMHMMWWTLTYNHENTKRFEHHKEKLLKMLKDYDDFNIGI